MDSESENRSKEFDTQGIRPWGPRLSEYRAFFALDDLHSRTPILDVGAGSSSFNAEATALGARVVSVDPIYDLEEAQFRAQFANTAAAMRDGLQRAAYRFTWNFYGSDRELYKMRFEALELFLADLARGKSEGRYVTAALPELPFASDSFRLAVSSHFLFLYCDKLDLHFHLRGLDELLRVAEEVRIFPLLNMDGRPSEHLFDVMNYLWCRGFHRELVRVPFEFQKGATHMLQVRR
jgi:SAM-dependent methyltransferase